MTQPRWSTAMTGNWGYVLEGLEEGLSGAESLRQFRAGGGSIRTQDWYYLRRVGTEMSTQSRRAEGWEDTLTLPESVYTEVDQNFRRDYKATATIRGYNTVTGRMETRKYSVSDDQSLSPTEWMDAIVDQAKRYDIDLEMPGSRIMRIDYQRKMVV